MSARTIQAALLAAIMAVVPLWYAAGGPGWGLNFFRSVPPHWALIIGMLLAVCAWCEDSWAGGLVAYLIGRALITPRPGGLETGINAVLGLGILMCARSLPERHRTVVRWVALTVASVQVVYLAGNMAHVPWFSWEAWEGGTLGNPNYVGSFLAIASAWGPIWLLPAFGVGIICSRSALAALAMGLVLVLRFPRKWWVFVGPLALGLATWWLRGPATTSWLFRAAVWRFGISTWIRGAPIWGYGPGAWMRAGPEIVGERPFGQAHNEVLQLAFEGGLIALILLGGWAWQHRRDLLATSGLPVIAAIGVESLGMFPFHIPSVAVLALVALGFATRRDHETLDRAPAAV